MGALTSINRKRADDYCKSLVSISPPFDQSYGHISKKPKRSAFANPGRNWPHSIVSRLHLYPDSKPRFSREVHAPVPVRLSRFGSCSQTKKVGGSAGFEESSAGNMGNCLGIQFQYEKVKNGAIQSLNFCWKDSELFVGEDKLNEVIQIDDAEDENRVDVSDDSSVEEVRIVDVLGRKWKDGYTAVENSPEQKLGMVEKDLRSLDSSVVNYVNNPDEKVDGVEQMMDVILLDEEPNALHVPVHKKLYDSAKGRDGKIKSLELEIEYNEKHRQRFQLLRSQEKREQIRKDVVEECFVPLTEEEEALVAHALSSSNRRKVLVSHENSNIDITGENLQCLSRGAWLNDEVINLYLELLKEREKREPLKFLKCHFFNTFFYKKLISGRDGYNFQSVRRWTTQRKLGYSLLDCEKIFVPIHKEVHWCLAIINKRDKKFLYLDSLKGVDNQVLTVLVQVQARYYVDEVKDKSGEDINVSSWEQELVSNLPDQKNGFDCGMFMIKYADFYSRDIGLCFNQGNMPYFRRRTVKEILKLRAE
ncbi:ubiquitin-like-specific protease ESD4 isoform X1 [Sesamum indicum]|uniref:Ubiquitin-like-specific protease ESD4 isoform X1 n=1 Tax=Sesamum indicum TaxID=4182 RepID=A0A8M8UQN8_SESIN|nr:ubiquitin-like-specific protease ESD4 isoform X1 [Sesamum indicum]